MDEESDKDTLEAFGFTLKKLRIRNGISQEEFAERTKLNRTYISGLECGKRNPSFLTLLKLAKALALPVEQLFILENESRSD